MRLTFADVLLRTMITTVPISVRADPALVNRVEAFAAEVMAERPGLKVTRTAAILMLVTEALDARDAERTRPARKQGKRAARRT